MLARIGAWILLGIFLGIWNLILTQPEPALKIFSAGSLKLPLAAIAAEFQELHPVGIQIEPSGSIEALRKYLELGKPADLIAVSDQLLLKQLLGAPWHIGFASNRMVLAYTERSKHSSKIDSRNWLELVSDPQVRLGISDPNKDPCGYRAIMVLLLASDFYRDSRILELLETWAKLNRSGLHVRMPKDFGPADPNKLVIRPKEIELVGLLQAGTLDYALIYKSIAIQHGLRFVQLPPQIDLGDLNQDYSKVQIQLGSGYQIQGSPIIYGISSTQDSRNPKLGLEFIQFMLSNSSRKLLEQLGFQPIFPALGYGRVPEELMESLLIQK